MSIEIKVTISQALQDKLRKLKKVRQDCMDVASRVMLNWLKDYHTNYGNAEKWNGPNHITGNQSGRFAADVVMAWQPAEKLGDGSFSISNIHPYLSHKITGGSISPKRGAALTIPLIPEAKGRLSAEFATSLGVKLFRRGNALSYRKGNQIVNAYALSRGVNQSPWPGAMPSDEAIQSAFTGAIQTAFEALNL